MKYTILLFALLAIGACSENKPAEKANPERSRVKAIEILQGADIRMSVIDTTHTDSTVNYEVVAKGIKDANEMGFVLSIPKQSGAGGIGNDLAFKSIGKKSNFFLYILSVLYGQEMVKPKKFADEIKVTYADIRKMTKAAVEDSIMNSLSNVDVDYMLFFHNVDDDVPAPLLLNIDSAATYIELKENDPVYRSRILKALSKKEKQGE